MKGKCYIRIERTIDKQFNINGVSHNTQTLSNTENLNRRRGCIVNILAQWKIFEDDYVLVKDETYDPVQWFKLFKDGRKEMIENIKTFKP